MKDLILIYKKKMNKLKFKIINISYLILIKKNNLFKI
jgi:hypothetical protein